MTGLLAVGDAHTCTNPLYGRGCSLAFVGAHLLADAVKAHAEDATAAAVAFETAMGEEVLPWYRAAVAQDRADRASRGIEAAGDEVGSGDARSLLRDGLLPATRTDPVVFRAFLRTFNLLDPPDAMLRDPDVLGRVLTVWQGRADRPDPPPAGPDRDALLALLGSAGSATGRS